MAIFLHHVAHAIGHALVAALATVANIVFTGRGGT